MGVLVVLMSLFWLDKPDLMEWMGNTWTFSKLLVPLLFGGVFVVGFLGALVPEKQVAALVGDNSLVSNLIASLVGCIFYFATLTEVPILEALIKNGMASGPALALLLAGPALSLPSILVIRSVVGNTRTAAFVVLTVMMATIAGMGFGSIYPEHGRTPAAQSQVVVVSEGVAAATAIRAVSVAGQERAAQGPALSPTSVVK
jgi:uncharacterized membrane protein YraQ (UPF0718 family)